MVPISCWFISSLVIARTSFEIQVGVPLREAPCRSSVHHPVPMVAKIRGIGVPETSST